MTRRSLAAAALTMACLFTSHVQAQELRRGVNTFPWLYRLTPNATPADGPAFYSYAAQFSAGAFKNLKDAGLDFVRIPINPTPLLTATPESRLAILNLIFDEINRKITGQGMTALIDFHPRDIDKDWTADAILRDAAKLAIYETVLVETARMASERKIGPVVLELMNEPPGGWGWRDRLGWPDAQKRLLASVRAVAPDLRVMLTGDKGGSVDGLDNLGEARDENPLNLYSFHYYEPIAVTHQGAGWTSRPWRKFMKNIPYPPVPDAKSDVAAAFSARVAGSDLSTDDKAAALKEGSAALDAYFGGNQGPARIAADFAKVSDWAKKRGVAPSRILLGEFGVLRPGAQLDTVVAYVGDVRRAAEAAGFGWAYFNYAPHTDPGGGFDVLKMTGQAKDDWDPGIIQKGLGLKLVCGAATGRPCAP